MREMECLDQRISKAVRLDENTSVGTERHVVRRCGTHSHLSDGVMCESSNGTLIVTMIDVSSL